jgi:hypothetical protein
MNGVQDDGEEDLAGWVMELHKSEDSGTTWMKIAEGVTASDGTVTFTNLDPYYLYRVDEEILVNWKNTTVASVIISVQPNATAQVEFGNIEVPERDVEAIAQTATSSGRIWKYGSSET